MANLHKVFRHHSKNSAEAYPKERYKAGMTESDCAREVEKFKQMMSKR